MHKRPTLQKKIIGSTTEKVYKKIKLNQIYFVKQTQRIVKTILNNYFSKI